MQAFLASVTVTDSVDPAPTLTNDAPAIFPIGETIVTFTATDAAGNVARCANLVTVNGARRPDGAVPRVRPGAPRRPPWSVRSRPTLPARSSLPARSRVSTSAVQSLLACAQTIDADKRAKCKAKASAGCTNELAKIAAAKDVLAAAVPIKCGAVSFADAANDGGLGYGDPDFVRHVWWPDQCVRGPR